MCLISYNTRLGSLCLIPGCAKPVHIDANGTKSQYCCYSHRIQGQQSGAAGSPPSTNPTQGNPPNIPGAYPHGNQNPVRSHPPVQPGMCHYPNCLKPVWVDPVGNPSKYCGRKHKE
ncbi:hypothetical protein M408DRAFT_114761 [Serendipita vermifera MAFF 305830]|uniref:Uncharacterized protein n=1 Tax=Serendipita vermifera MAFF 305830 TaxID=933852 RepID=A0A0C3BBM9_SERVB|nr:hypothetical protein M408DRAFT_114761 [Serendipita vermifera MAFF 305830]